FRQRIFQRFAQGDSSDTRRRDGTGLGLSITKAIIERMGGTIDYHSMVGKGSRFYFTLPIAK
ncbi:MAG TPA: ATP-binding protein, partial [Cellvibrio sp.]